MSMPEEEWMPISALQHYEFCPRQFALIHVEQYWHESFFTADGRARHDRVDLPGGRRGKQRHVDYALPVAAPPLGIYGRVDAVETLYDAGGTVAAVFPIEYKRGHPKSGDCDIIQLCAQALCLEAMLAVAIPEAALFYFETRSRLPVALDEPVRRHTLEVIAACRKLFDTGEIPVLPYDRKRCAACSLLEYCMPPRPGTDARHCFEEMLS